MSDYDLEQFMEKADRFAVGLCDLATAELDPKLVGDFLKRWITDTSTSEERLEALDESDYEGMLEVTCVALGAATMARYVMAKDQRRSA
tara:strand:+ start:913 stop:1179 length:267 start_codon:yes stop_codon:yes gene_type:complete